MKHFISSLSVINANTPPCEGRVSSRKILSLLLILFLSIGNAWGQTVTWEKATSIAAGDVVALVCESKKMELSGISTTSTKYGTGVAYTSAPNGKYELTVEAGSSTGTFSLKNGSNYLYWSSGNSLNKTTTKDAKASWTITFSNGNAIIKNANTSARQLQWNASSPRFACYDNSGQTAVQLYKKVISEESEDVIVKMLKSIEVTPKTINYETGDVFKFDGTCTATYGVTKNDEPQADETVVVTPTTVSTPDMSTAGTKEITVTYTEDGVTVTDTYEIEVTQNEVTPGAYTGNLNNTFFGCATGNIAAEQSGKFNDVLVVAGCKSSASSKTYYAAGHVRFYADSYLTISVPAGYVIKSIVFTADGTWNGSITASAGTYTDGTKTWVGNAQEVKFSFAAQNRIKSVEVTYAADVKYALNITTPSNGTLVVKDGSTVLADGAQVYDGTKLVVTPTPATGYVFESLTVGGEAVELTDGTYTFNMPAADVTIAATFKENEKSPATLTLSKNGVTEDITGYKQDDKVELPSITSDCVKAFVGWSADDKCATEPEYKADEEYTLTKTAQTLYAVYATVGGGGETTASVNMATYATANSWGSTSSTNQKQITINSDVKAVISAGGNSGKYYDDGVRIYQSESATVTISTTVGELKSVKFTFINSNSGTLLYGSTTLTSNKAVEVSGTSAVFSVGDTDASENKGQIRFTAIEVTYASAPTYSDYSTTCAAAPKAEVNPTTVSATAAGANGKVTVTYDNVKTEDVTVALYNDAACTDAFTADWLTASLDGDKNIAYTVAATTLYTERKAYIKLTAPETTGAIDPAVVVIPVTQAGKDKVFASLEELLANITPTEAPTKVTVTLTKEPIVEIYVSGTYRNGIYLNVPYQGENKKIEIYCWNVPATWVLGGSVSGTLTNCDWKDYNGTWELCPADWSELTYTAPATVSSIAVSGTPTTTTYVDGEKFDPAGLVVTATYSDATTEVVTTYANWTIDPATLTKGQTSVNVTATYNSISSAAHEVTGLTVNDIPTKTVDEFIAAEGGRCYLEGIVSNITNTTYGNFDLTDASGTIYVYGCLNTSGESKKFAELGVKNGDKVKVIADQFKVYGGKDQATDVQYVSHISAATITIADITMEVGETKTIAATVVPAEAKVTYTIKKNEANAISLSGNVITANTVGSATITATVAEGATYLSNSVDFKVTVTPKSEKTNVVILAEYNGEWYAMTNACTDNKQMGALKVTYVNGVILDFVGDKASITWERAVVGNKATFKNNGKYLVGGASPTLNYTSNTFEWDVVEGKYLSDANTRTFLFQGSYFKNYAISNAGKTTNGTTYSAMPVVTAVEFMNSVATPSVEKGIFSVADGKFVQFSTGNLQYNVGTNTWSFASEQYDYVGEENINVGNPSYTGKIDMFGWSADGKFGVNPSNTDDDYNGDFVDWGTLVNEEDWYTLSADEWKYLLNKRTNASSLKQIAKVDGAVGIMLFPDAWTMPTDVNVTAEYDSYFKVNIYNYTLEQWEKLETVGAVFLPAAGRRAGGYGNMINKDQVEETNPDNLNDGHYKHYDNGNIYCYYWTSTINESTKVSYLHNIQALGGDKYTIGTGAVWSEKGRYGQSVRLVKAIEPDHTRSVTSGDYGTICLPNGGLLLGASAFSVAKMEGTTILLDEVGTTMVGGTPYVVFPNTGAKNLYVFYTDNANTPAGNANGLYGSYTREPLAPNAGYYIMLPGNRYAEVTGDRVFVAANRAYFKVDDIEDISTTAPAPAPGVRRIAIGQAPQVATGMENIDASAQPVKMIIDGQLYILRGEKMYDAQGKLVK